MLFYLFDPSQIFFVIILNVSRDTGKLHSFIVSYSQRFLKIRIMGYFVMEARTSRNCRMSYTGGLYHKTLTDKALLFFKEEQSVRISLEPISFSFH